jgi:hypothetical protein
MLYRQSTYTNSQDLFNIVGIEGDKNDRLKWINNVFRQSVYDIVVRNIDPIPNLKQESLI